ncbi:MAG: (S)-ureidoglycine aminohydrolase [Verrucomicrobia bacterium]|nr:(S)-ureidoglycine aminohydrolase [Verrucomicrobiota bacterium]
MNDLFGCTRTVVQGRYALLTPDSFVASNLPGWKSAVCVVNISPALGARFTQLLVTLDQNGVGEGNTGPNEYFLYVIEGAGSIVLGERRHRLEAGSYVFLPPDTDIQVKSGGDNLRLLIFQKRYESLAGAAKLESIIAHERDVKGRPFHGDEAVRLQALLPNEPAYDLAVNILTFPPGAAHAFVSAQLMERGAMLLKGQGICRLGADWHPVRTGDVIWTAPYCPQWFVAMGKTPASCIYFEDVNRDPM